MTIFLLIDSILNKQKNVVKAEAEQKVAQSKLPKVPSFSTTEKRQTFHMFFFSGNLLCGSNSSSF
jgi:hypothetical protein